MHRRDFLLAGAVLAASGSLAGSVSTKPAKKMAVTINRIATDNGFVAEVAGPPEQVRAFVESYQTRLWPDWRTHKSDLARKQMDRFRKDHERGYAMLSMQDGQMYNAVLATADEFFTSVSVPG